MEVLINALQKAVPFWGDLGALIIAAISLLVAVISLFKSSKAQRLQNKVNELELKIKQNELDRMAQHHPPPLRGIRCLKCFLRAKLHQESI